MEVAPCTSERAFNCPHCGALAKQFWHALLAEELSKDTLPPSFSPEEANTFGKEIEDKETRARFKRWATKISQRTPFLDDKKRDPYAFSSIECVDLQML